MRFDVSRYDSDTSGDDVIIERMDIYGNGFQPPRTFVLKAQEIPHLIKQLFLAADDKDQDGMSKMFAQWRERNQITRPELVHELRLRLVTMTDEAPYCVIPRSLVASAINALDLTATEGDPLLDEIRSNCTAREFSILTCLDHAAGAIVPYDRILAVTGIKNHNALWAHTCRLRDKLKKSNWGVVISARGYGYAYHRPGKG